MDTNIYDYAIIGAGAAGLHLALAMIEAPDFSNKKVLIIDKSAKDTNDRTWCFWEQGEGKWDGITSKIWSEGSFITENNNKSLDIYPYRYKMVRGIDFYNHAGKVISLHDNFKRVTADVINVKENNIPEIVTSIGSFLVNHVFDSRVERYSDGIESVGVLQHFKGWMIRTNEDVFDADKFVMMDFRLKLDNKTGFFYILPTSTHEALVEFTLFTPDLIDESGYDSMLKEYIEKILNIKEYNIIETEYGVIPMTTHPFHKMSTTGVTKIGTAGSWVKPSSGYSFKNCEINSMKILANINSGNPPAKGIAGGRHRKYDTLLLEILQNSNELGEEVFTSLYQKNPASLIFKFLDEKTSFAEDLKIILSFKPDPFRKALMKHWKSMV